MANLFTGADTSKPNLNRQGLRMLLGGYLRPALSFFGLGIVVMLMWPVLEWAVIDAYWTGSGGDACPDTSGACWPFIAERFDQLMYGAYPLSERWRVNLGLAIGLCLLVPIMVPRVSAKAVWVILFIAVYPVIAIILFSGGVLGLAVVETSSWGGLFLTLVIGVFAFAFALPSGILLALGRESRAPIIRMLSGTWVELWRSVPTLVVLFVAVIMLPLFLPR
jgi:general L-amino acid transport system permease protein